MRIAYLSIDEVNQAQATQWADQVRGSVEIVLPRDELTPGSHDVLLLDLDFLPTELCRTLLARLLGEPLPGTVAVHSYNVHGEVLEALRSRGVLVHRRLEAVLARLTALRAGGANAVAPIPVADRRRKRRHAEQPLSASSTWN